MVATHCAVATCFNAWGPTRLLLYSVALRHSQDQKTRPLLLVVLGCASQTYPTQSVLLHSYDDVRLQLSAGDVSEDREQACAAGQVLSGTDFIRWKVSGSRKLLRPTFSSFGACQAMPGSIFLDPPKIPSWLASVSHIVGRGAVENGSWGPLTCRMLPAGLV